MYENLYQEQQRDNNKSMAFIEDLVTKVGLKDKLIETRDVEIVLLKK